MFAAGADHSMVCLAPACGRFARAAPRGKPYYDLFVRRGAPGICKGRAAGSKHSMVCFGRRGGSRDGSRGRIQGAVGRHTDKRMALPPDWPLRSPWAELDAFLSKQPLTLRSSYDVHNVHGGGIGLWWSGCGGHIELAHENGAYLTRLPHELVRASRRRSSRRGSSPSRARRACRRRRAIRATWCACSRRCRCRCSRRRPHGRTAPASAAAARTTTRARTATRGRAPLSRCSARPPGGGRAPASMILIKCERAGTRYGCGLAARRFGGGPSPQAIHTMVWRSQGAPWICRRGAPRANHTMVR